MRMVLGQLAGVLDHQALDVEDDVGHVLDDAGDRADFVLHALDLDAGDGAAFEAGEQDAAQAVADGHAEAALERLGVELAVGVGQRLRSLTTRLGNSRPRQRIRMGEVSSESGSSTEDQPPALKKRSVVRTTA